MKQREATLDWAILYPGEAVPLPGHPEQQINVYPLGLHHLQAFTDQLCALIGAVKTVDVPADADRGQILQALLAALGPGALERLIDLMDSCCSVSVKRAPIPVIMAVGKAWVGQLWESEKAHPFFAALGGMVRGAVLQAMIRHQLSMGSISSSPTVTDSPTSSDAARSDSTAANSPT